MDTVIYCCYVLWQMLCHMFFGIKYALADVIAILVAYVVAILCVVDAKPLGRWYRLLLSKVADVIAIILCVADVMQTKYVCCNCCVADVIAKVTDGIAYHGGCRGIDICYSHKWQMEWPLGQFSFNLSSGMLNRTSCHMCDRWYLPIFLLRDGLLTLIYKASLMVLMRFWSFLPTILKLSMVTV